jgi:hypothetical protein
MDSSLARAVTEAEIALYERDGLVLLRNIHPQTWGDTLRATIDELFTRDVNAKPISEGHAGGEAKGARMDIVKMARRQKKNGPITLFPMTVQPMHRWWDAASLKLTLRVDVNPCVLTILKGHCRS